MHQRHIGSHGLTENQPDDGPEQQRVPQARAAAEARQRRPVEAG